MGLFRLRVIGSDLTQGQLIEASRTNLDLEQHLENWLERSPGASAGEALLQIGRQTSAAVEDQRLFPDLIGIDEEVPALNQGLRLFIVAEDIPPTVARVCRFLRTSQGLDISCLEVSTYQTGADDVLVSLNPVVGQEDIAPPKHPPKSRWTGEKPVKQVVWEAVVELTQSGKHRIFSPKEVAENILKKYPAFIEFHLLSFS